MCYHFLCIDSVYVIIVYLLYVVCDISIYQYVVTMYAIVRYIDAAYIVVTPRIWEVTLKFAHYKTAN